MTFRLRASPISPIILSLILLLLLLAAPFGSAVAAELSMEGAAASVSGFLARLGLHGVAANMVVVLGLFALLTLIIMIGLHQWRRRDGEPMEMQEPVLAGMPPGGASMPPTDAFAPEMPAARQRLAPNAALPGGQHTSSGRWGVPPEFDVPAFLRLAKTCFIRLQAAWDKGDLGDIHEFTAPDVYAELKMQVSERGPTTNRTDVAILHAELLGMETTALDYRASVKFSGMIKETAKPMAEPFIEIWHLSRPLLDNQHWTVTAIQQLQ